VLEEITCGSLRDLTKTDVCNSLRNLYTKHGVLLDQGTLTSSKLQHDAVPQKQPMIMIPMCDMIVVKMLFSLQTQAAQQQHWALQTVWANGPLMGLTLQLFHGD